MRCAGGLGEKIRRVMQHKPFGLKASAHSMKDVSTPKQTPTFAVVLASFNGMCWIDAQITSILVQEDVNVTIFVSDDGSLDGTREWLENRSAEEPRIKLLPTNPRFGGAAKNFFRLIRDVDLSQFDYLALADQDDLWLPQKLLIACRMMAAGSASAYSGNVTAFWPDGRERETDKAHAQRDYDFLFEAAGPGCTYVLTIDAAQKCKSFMIENWAQVNEISLHDWFIYAWFRASRLKWLIDQKSYVKYRQHQANQVGVNFGWKAAASRFKLLQKKWYRSQVGKIAALGVMKNDAVAAFVGRHGGAVSLSMLVRHGSEFRRRARDRLYLGLFIILRLY